MGRGPEVDTHPCGFGVGVWFWPRSRRSLSVLSRWSHAAAQSRWLGRRRRAGSQRSSEATVRGARVSVQSARSRSAWRPAVAAKRIRAAREISIVSRLVRSWTGSLTGHAWPAVRPARRARPSWHASRSSDAERRAPPQPAWTARSRSVAGTRILCSPPRARSRAWTPAAIPHASPATRRSAHARVRRVVKTWDVLRSVTA